MGVIKPIYELLMWNNCNNCCRFCFMKAMKEKNKNKFLSDPKKIESVQKAWHFISNGPFKRGSHLLLVGGELFDSHMRPDLDYWFKDLLKNVLNAQLKGDIDLLYINTNLIYKDLSLLEFFLDQVDSKDLFGRLKFTTSWDVEGRFEVGDKLLMEENLRYVTNKYPKINVVVNSILTKPFCDEILSDRYVITDFMDEFRVSVNTIPYIILDPNLAAPRGKIFDAIEYLDVQCPGYAKSYYDNVLLPQDKFLYEFDGNEYVYMTAENSECGHNVNFKRYTVDGNHCFLCDCQSFRDSFHV